MPHQLGWAQFKCKFPILALASFLPHRSPRHVPTSLSISKHKNSESLSPYILHFPTPKQRRNQRPPHRLTPSPLSLSLRIFQLDTVLTKDSGFDSNRVICAVSRRIMNGSRQVWSDLVPAWSLGLMCLDLRLFLVWSVGGISIKNGVAVKFDLWLSRKVRAARTRNTCRSSRSTDRRFWSWCKALTVLRALKLNQMQLKKFWGLKLNSDCLMIFNITSQV
jgi:hypothetical protein